MKQKIVFSPKFKSAFGTEVLYTHLNGMKKKIKETEAGVAAAKKVIT